MILLANDLSLDFANFAVLHDVYLHIRCVVCYVCKYVGEEGIIDHEKKHFYPNFK